MGGGAGGKDHKGHEETLGVDGYGVFITLGVISQGYTHVKIHQILYYNIFSLFYIKSTSIKLLKIK